MDRRHLAGALIVGICADAVASILMAENIFPLWVWIAGLISGLALMTPQRWVDWLRERISRGGWWNHVADRLRQLRFRKLALMIDSVRLSVVRDNPSPASVSDLRMSPETTSEVKLLMRRLEKLSIPYPDGRRIDAWIDWLPYLQSLAEDGDLREARSIDPYETTLSRLARGRHGRDDTAGREGA